MESSVYVYGGVVGSHDFDVRPPFLTKGNKSRQPSGAGGATIVKVSPNRQSVDVDTHNWCTDNNESENDETQRTLRRVRSTSDPLLSRARRGRSPTAVHVCARPSIPATRSEHGRTFT
eukprot:5577291-Pleurochrysis_carterae.AAC.1